MVGHARALVVFVAASATHSVAQSPSPFKVVDEMIPGGVGYVLPVDLDGDGDMDLLAPQWEQLALNDGSGGGLFTLARVLPASVALSGRVRRSSAR